MGYEGRDISVRGVGWFAAALVISAVVIQIAVGLLFDAFKERHPSPQSPSRIVFNAKMRAPAPRLQANPVLDLESFRSQEERELGTYGRTDNGGIRIPVEKAMELVLKRGLPVRKPGSKDGSGRTVLDMQRQKAEGG